MEEKISFDSIAFLLLFKTFVYFIRRCAEGISNNEAWLCEKWWRDAPFILAEKLVEKGEKHGKDDSGGEHMLQQINMDKNNLRYNS